MTGAEPVRQAPGERGMSIEDEIHDLRLIFEMQYARMGDATERWRAEDPAGRALVMPDLGALLAWLMADADKARAEAAELRARAQTTGDTRGNE